MAEPIRLSWEFIQSAAQEPGVREAVEKVADRIAKAAEKEGGDRPTDVWVESGTRPAGRPYSYVNSDDVEGEWGSPMTARRRRLGRASESAR